MLIYLLGHLGLEPRTIRLKAEYSTIELVTRCYTIIVYMVMIFFHRFKAYISSILKNL